jgi:hypothetical protein
VLGGVYVGYTHYWEREREFDKAAFEKVRRDFMKVVTVLAGLGVELAGPGGDGDMLCCELGIAFNGVRACQHPARELGIAWPAAGAGGVCLAYADDGSSGSDVGGQWFAGRELQARTCGGDCSHESFWLPRVRKVESWEQAENELVFGFCKTAYKPYDLAVQVCLVIARHHLGSSIRVRSDGSLQEWQDAISLCQEELGYGGEFRLA